MIWGFALEPGREYTRTSEEEVHLSLAAIESRSEFGKAGSYSQLMLKTETSEQLLCTLVHGTIFQQCLDLKLMPGEKVTFTVQGSCGVYVTGYSYRSPLEPASDESSVGHEDTAGDDGIMYDGDVQIKSEAEDNDYFKGVSGDEEMTDANLYGGAVNEKEQDCSHKGKGRMDTFSSCNLISIQNETSVGISPDHQTSQFHTSEPTFDRPSKNPAAHQMQQDLPLPEDDVSILSQEHPESQRADADMSSSETIREPFGGEDMRDIPGPSRETVVGDVQESAPSITSEVIRDENGGSVHHPEGEITRQSSTNAWSSEIPARQHTSNVSKKASLVSTVDRLKQSDQQGQRSKSGTSGKILVSSSQLSPGLKQIPPDDRYICPLCSEVFPAKDALLAHENKHAQEGKMFSCRYCHMVFMQKGNRNIHERIHSAMRHNFRAAYKSGGGDPAEKHQPTQPSSSEENLKEVSSVPKQNSSTKAVVNSSNRESTSENFRSANVRKAKSEANTSIRPHPYPHYSGLGLRAQQAMEQKNYKCQYCQKPFKRNYDRNRHERIHTGQKPYGCSFCDQAFSRREHCKKHEFTHFRSRLKDEPAE